MDGHSVSQIRVVVTGIGVVSSAGRTADQFWKTLTGVLSDTTLQSLSLDPDNPTVSGRGAADFAGSINDFCDLPDAQRKAIRKALKLMNRETQMGIAAGQQALADSGIAGQYEPDRLGVYFGADNVSIMPDDFQRGIEACSSADGHFDVERWGEDGIEEVAPLWLLKCLPNMPACHLAIINDLRGPGNTITQRDVSANMAVAEACRSIRSGVADAVLVGATGTTLTTFNQMHARFEGEISESDSVCRPFDRCRTGSAPGEGAGTIVLEEMHSALRRGATIYGEVLGAASASAVGLDRMAACRTATASAMRQTLRRSGQSTASIGHIHAHGLGTRESDLAEAQAIRDIFGDLTSTTPVMAAKGHLGNAAAGSGAMELIASLLALKHGHLFPVLHYRDADPECRVCPVTRLDEPAGTSFLNVNMFGRGLASCVAVAAFSA